MLYAQYKLLGFNNIFTETFDDSEEAYKFREWLRDKNILVQDSFSMTNETGTIGYFTTTVLLNLEEKL